MAKSDIIVIGASAGGIVPLMELIGNLRPRMEVSIFVVVHISLLQKAISREILNRSGHLKAIESEGSEKTAEAAGDGNHYCHERQCV